MPISGRFVIGTTIVFLTIGFLMLVGIVGTNVWLSDRAQTYATNTIDARDIRIAAVELRNAVQSAEASQRGFLVSGNEIYLAPFDTNRASAERHLEALRRLLAADASASGLLSRLTEVLTQKFEDMDATTKLKRDQRDADALAIFQTNKGKALADEANLFLSAIIRKADERLTDNVMEQTSNADWLRIFSIIGGLVIIGVVGAVMITVLRYAREIVRARDEVRIVNSSLEQRVERRTHALAEARDRAEVLVTEVNHRVANSLSLVAAFVSLQARTLKDGPSRDALRETEARISAIAAVHKRLYISPDARVVELDQYLPSLLGNLATSMNADGHGASLRYDVSPLKMSTDASIHLGIIVTEWVTNAFKYAYPDRRGEVRVGLRRLPDGRGELAVEDDGAGLREGVTQGSGLGTRIVKAMAETMRADIFYAPRNPGTSAKLIFPCSENCG
jgi:two-component sensor histidine kinase/CHASE3 domain sensor protein